VKRHGLNNVVELVGRPRPRTDDAPSGRRARRIVAVGGGKGGIGKSLVSANLGIALARAGHRVTLVDVDLGGANLHTCLGINQPQGTLSDVVTKGSRLEGLAAPTGIDGLSLVSGAMDALDAANPRAQARARLVEQLQTLDADYLVLDLGAGTSLHTIDFFLLADHGVLVLLPEPTSVENAYRFLKAALFRRLQQTAQALGVAQLAEVALGSQGSAMRTPAEVVKAVAEQSPDAAAQLERSLRDFRVKLVVNQVRSPADQGVGRAVVAAWKKFFGLDMDYLGAIAYDDAAWQTVRRRKPLLLDAAGSSAAANLVTVAEALVSLDRPRAAGR
jgi:flagellar biosynthesis protein FlhG